MGAGPAIFVRLRLPSIVSTLTRLWYGEKAMPVRLLWVGCLVVACWLGSGPRSALADDGAVAAKELFKKGQAHYALGEYDAAAEAYQSAYKLKPDPALLFNAGQAYRLGGKLDRALTIYRNYLRFYPDVENAETVRGQIAKLEKQIEAERAVATAPPAVPSPALEPPAATPPAAGGRDPGGDAPHGRRAVDPVGVGAHGR